MEKKSVKINSLSELKENKLFKVGMEVLYPLISISLILIIWLIAAKALNKPLIFPEPKVVFKEFFDMLGYKETFINAGWTLLRTIECFLLSVVIALLLSQLGAIFKPLHKIFSPIITILRAAPTLAVILLAMIWFDYEDAPIIIGFLIAFPLLYSSFYTATIEVDQNLLKMAKVFKVSKINIIRFIYIPSIKKPCLESMKSVISLTVKVVIATEIMALVKDSIGQLMRVANLSFDISKLIAYTLLSIILSFILEGLFALIIKLTEVKKWR